jgi:hypothetical protein
MVTFHEKGTFSPAMYVTVRFNARSTRLPKANMAPQWADSRNERQPVPVILLRHNMRRHCALSVHMTE